MAVGTARPARSSPPERLIRLLGGPAEAKIVLLFAAVLALNAADLGAVGAVAPQLEADFGINQTQLGLLATVSGVVGALACLPMGALADRANRVRLLAGTVTLWSIALGVGGLAPSYSWLLVSRVALGGASAAAGPVLASLAGDLFPVGDRARIYGRVLTGEIAGAGAGLLAGGAIAAALSWRYAFWLLSLLGFGLVWLLWRLLAEPARDVRHRPAGQWRSLWSGFGYVLRTPTIRLLVIASAVGYFFFAGLRTFAVVFVEAQYHVGMAQVTGLALVIGCGALAGVLSVGRLADVVLRGRVRAVRVVLPGLCYMGAAILLAPAMLTTSIWLALPLLTAGAAMLAATNPPLDAARLDLAPADLWGRTESARTVLRLGAEGVAPVTFGAVADLLGHSTTPGPGLRAAFLIMLVPLLANGAIVLTARHTYEADARAAQQMAPAGSTAAGLAPEVGR